MFAAESGFFNRRKWSVRTFLHAQRSKEPLDLVETQVCWLLLDTQVWECSQSQIVPKTSQELWLYSLEAEHYFLNSNDVVVRICELSCLLM